jgi:hypothetical protein
MEVNIRDPLDGQRAASSAIESSLAQRLIMDEFNNNEVKAPGIIQPKSEKEVK